MRWDWGYIGRYNWRVHVLGLGPGTYLGKQNNKVGYKGSVWQAWTIFNSPVYNCLATKDSYVDIKALQVKASMNPIVKKEPIQ